MERYGKENKNEKYKKKVDNFTHSVPKYAMKTVVTHDFRYRYTLSKLKRLLKNLEGCRAFLTDCSESKVAHMALLGKL